MENDKITQNSDSVGEHTHTLAPVDDTIENKDESNPVLEADKKDKNSDKDNDAKDSDKSDKDESDKNEKKSKKQDTKESDSSRKELEKKTDSIMKEIGKLKPEHTPATNIRDQAIAQIDEFKSWIKNREINGDSLAEQMCAIRCNISQLSVGGDHNQTRKFPNMTPEAAETLLKVLEKLNELDGLADDLAKKIKADEAQINESEFTLTSRLTEGVLSQQFTIDSFHETLRQQDLQDDLQEIAVETTGDNDNAIDVVSMDRDVAAAAEVSFNNRDRISGIVQQAMAEHDSRLCTRIRMAESNLLEVAIIDTSGVTRTEYVQVDPLKRQIMETRKPTSLQALFESKADNAALYMLKADETMHAIEYPTASEEQADSEIRASIKEAHRQKTCVDVFLVDSMDSIDNKLIIDESAIAHAGLDNPNLNFTACKVQELIAEHTAGEYDACRMTGQDGRMNVIRYGTDGASWTEHFDYPTAERDTDISEEMPPYPNGTPISEGDAVALSKHPNSMLGKVVDVVDTGDETSVVERWEIHVEADAGDSGSMVFYPRDLMPFSVEVVTEETEDDPDMVDDWFGNIEVELPTGKIMRESDEWDIESLPGAGESEILGVIPKRINAELSNLNQACDLFKQTADSIDAWYDGGQNIEMEQIIYWLDHYKKLGNDNVVGYTGDCNEGDRGMYYNAMDKISLDAESLKQKLQNAGIELNWDDSLFNPDSVSWDMRQDLVKSMREICKHFRDMRPLLNQIMSELKQHVIQEGINGPRLEPTDKDSVFVSGKPGTELAEVKWFFGDLNEAADYVNETIELENLDSVSFWMLTGDEENPVREATKKDWQARMSDDIDRDEEEEDILTELGDDDDETDGETDEAADKVEKLDDEVEAEETGVTAVETAIARYEGFGEPIRTGDEVFYESIPSYPFGIVERVVNADEVWVQPHKALNEVIEQNPAFRAYKVGEPVWFQARNLSKFKRA